MIPRRVLVLLLLFITVLLSIPALAGVPSGVWITAVQTPAASGSAHDDRLPGIQVAVWRNYGSADTFEGSATFGPATPIPADQLDDARLSMIAVTVYEFDTAQNAATAFDQLSAEAEESFSTAIRIGTPEITTEELPDTGTRATLTRMDATGDISRLWLEYVTVQREQYVLLVSSLATAFNTPDSDPADPTLPSVPLATTIAADGEPSLDEPAFVADGTSTGGLWGFMPASDDPLLMELVPLVDTVIYPAPTG